MARKVGDVQKHIPTDELKKIVKDLSAIGISHNVIANYIHIDEDTLHKYYQKELRDGPPHLLLAAFGTLMQHVLKGSLPAAMFVLKTRGRWRETDNQTIDETHQNVAKLNAQMDALMRKHERDA